jgi:hypothetical protein
MNKKNNQVWKVQQKNLKMKIKHVEEGSWHETIKTNSDLQPKVQKIIMLPLDSTIYSSKC